MQLDNWFLIWIGSDMEKAFGPVLFDMIARTMPKERYILFDTKKEGRRPDTMKMLKDVYVAFKAEGEFPNPLMQTISLTQHSLQSSLSLPTLRVTLSSCRAARRTACTHSVLSGIHKQKTRLHSFQQQSILSSHSHSTLESHPPMLCIIIANHLPTH